LLLLPALKSISFTNDHEKEQFLSDIQTSGSAPSGSVGQTFKITDEGVMTFPISVSGSTSVTASIGVNHDPGAGVSVKPRLYLRHSHRNQPSSASVSTTVSPSTLTRSVHNPCVIGC